jgi:methyltransferase (TIGR00027 family)
MRNISDTARWVARYRAIESDRPDAWFHDPLAKRLAGDSGAEFANRMEFATRNSWSFVARTVLIDRCITQQIAAGADMVVNLAAGLDTRPYRLALPSNLPWIEIDLPELLAYKNDMLRDERPVCALERIALDLQDIPARRALFETLGRRASNAVILAEGLLIYLTSDEVAALATDLAQPRGFLSWILDLTSPALLRMLTRSMGANLEAAGAPLKFAPGEGPAFFARYGWRPVEAQSLLHAAAALKRLRPLFRLMALLPDPAGRHPNRPWGGVCLFERTEGARA